MLLVDLLKRCIPLEAFNVRTFSGGDTSGTHTLEGMGAGFIPELCRLDLAKIEGIFEGITSGAKEKR